MEPDHDTVLGGTGRGFPATHWSLILEGQEGNGAARARAWQSLAEGYWKPVFAYVQARWKKTREDAEDLTQDFFLWMMESDLLSRADFRKGRFRSFVQVSLRHFLCNVRDKDFARKRGAGRAALSIENGMTETIAVVERTPEEAFDEAWRNEILAQGAVILERAYGEEGKEAYYFVFRDYYLNRRAGTTYQVLAQRLGLSAGDVSNYLISARARYRQIVKDIVAQTVGTSEEWEREFSDLFRGSL